MASGIQAGTGIIPVSGEIPIRNLRPGRYRLNVQASDSTGKKNRMARVLLCYPLTLHLSARDPLGRPVRCGGRIVHSRCGKSPPAILFMMMVCVLSRFL